MTVPEDQLPGLEGDVPLTEEEKRAAEELRRALEDPARANDDANLLRAAALAYAPRELDAGEHRAIVAKALAHASPAKGSRGGDRGSSKVVRALFGAGAAAALALAAAVALFLEPHAARPSRDSRASASVPLVHVRSTQPLFREPFARTGGTSARIDRIAVARAGDLRDNEFSRWGVK
jgi:hypothetical protein